MTAGLQKGGLTILGARPSMGKTSFALGVAAKAAAESGKVVGVFSLEMPSERVLMRMLASEARLMTPEARAMCFEGRIGHWRNGDDERFRAPVERMSTSRAFIDSTPGLSVGDIRVRCREQSSAEPIVLVVIDYLQLLRGSAETKTREHEVTEICRDLKKLAQELDAPVLLLSQLSRTLESRENKRPVTGDLRESPAIAEYADTILFLYRDAVYDEDSQMKGIAEVIVAKQPNGQLGSCQLGFHEPWATFEDRPRE